ncbi:MAG TPA: ABC transporter permease [Gammaproteobacteria bacterium]
MLTLALGLVSFLLAYALVAFWDRAERAFPDADRVFVLTTSFTTIGGTFSRSGLTTSPLQAADLLLADFPAVERVARAVPLPAQTSVSTGDRALRFPAVAVDQDFLSLFPLPFAAGDRDAALARPRSAVVTREAATRLFGAGDPLGRRLLVDNAVEATVTGVVDHVPEPSHLGRSAAAPLRFDVLLSMDVLDAVQRAAIDAPMLEMLRSNWMSGNAVTYLLLPDAGAADALRGELAAFAARHVPQEEGSSVTFDLLPATALLRKSIDDELLSGDVGVSISGVLLALGVLVLGVACVNYANLATARAARRVREVGVRKALGAGPKHVALQHLFEATLMTSLAMAVALVTLVAVLPAAREMLGVDIGTVLFADPAVWLVLFAATLTAAFAAGSYPAFVLSRVAPIVALRSIRARLGAGRLSTLLVGAQFAAASLLIAALTVVSLQNAKLVRTGLGGLEDPLVLIENPTRITKVDPATLRAELLRVPQVKAVSEFGGLPWQRLVAVTFLSAAPEQPPRRVLTRSVGYGFFDVMGIDLLAGRVFEPERNDAAARAEGRATVPIVVDRAFAREFGAATPAEAVGMLVYGRGTSPPLEIVGVVEDRRLTFRGGGAVSTMYGLDPEGDVMYVRVDGNDVAGALAGIDAVWGRLAPDVAISRHFFDETFNRAYETFLRLNQAFGLLSATALAIAMAGLVGMAAIVVNHRRREIGVRKTFGASSAQIARLLIAAFSRPVVVANFAAWPIAYAAANEYLAAFLDPIALTPAPFALALAVTIAIAWLSVGAQVLRAARVVPGHVLREV